MCERKWTTLAVRAGSSIPVGKVCVNEVKCESVLDAAADTGAVSSTQMRPLMVIEMAGAKWQAVMWSILGIGGHLSVWYYMDIFFNRSMLRGNIYREQLDPQCLSNVTYVCSRGSVYF